MSALSPSDFVYLLLLVVLPLLAGAAGWAGWRALGYRRLPHTVPTSVRLIPWAPVLGSAALGVVTALVRDPDSADVFGPARMVATVVPLVAAMQAAFLFSPDDEPGLEVVLACPRPLAWTVVERLALLLAGQGTAALLGGLAASAVTQTSALEGVLAWAVPLVVLSAAAQAITLSTRQPLFSVGIILLLWFGMVWNSGPGGGFLLARWPHLWPLHLYLDPGHPDFWLNRVALLLAGLNLVVLTAAHLLRDEERVLLGGRPAARGGWRAPRQGEA